MNVKEFIKDVCDLDELPEDDLELIESEILDSLAVIELLSALEDEGIVIHLTQIDRGMLKTPASLQKLIDEAAEKTFAVK
ncbi:MAG: phosphopantetheine-binding protein [Oscillospiraceae bacterium]|nr:phosphopantetheine-binding protein [Oscillospiraceae bacterium]